MRILPGLGGLPFFLVLLVGCGENTLPLWLEFAWPDQEQGLPDLVRSDPQGVLAVPSLPADFLTKADEYNLSRQQDRRISVLWRYKVRVVTPDAPELEDAFLNVSLLERLKTSPPHAFANLNQRVRADLDTAREVMRAFGYYEGRCRSRITMESEEFSVEEAENTTERQLVRQMVVWMHFRPGTQFTLGRSPVLIVDADERIKSGQLGREERKLTLLADAGLAEGTPAAAPAILAAVNETRNVLRNSGYPFADLIGTRYIVDYDNKTLEAHITLRAGSFCRMGNLEVQGEKRVSSAYLEALRTWRPGQVWRENQTDRFVENLRRTGLFQSVEVAPGETADAEGTRPVVLRLAPAPERTVSGALKYNSDFGAGLEASWTHRNLTGRGDTLNIVMPLWQDMQVLFTQYRLPFLGDPGQDLAVQAALRHEDVRAYALSSLSAAAGLERRLSRRFSGGLKISAEAGALTAVDEPRRDFVLFGLPLSFTYSDTGSRLDASSGFRITAFLGPYYGRYTDNFTALRGHADLSVYLPLLRDQDTLQLALRGGIGSVMGARAENIPTSIRFYSGGSGSVRGYAYQSLGPRNAHDDPLGGASMVEFSLETRWRINSSWGIAAFADAGMVYADFRPDFHDSLRWGAGIGLRYYTVVGPLRLDLATPLTPRPGDGFLQLYCSIGQSF